MLNNAIDSHKCLNVLTILLKENFLISFLKVCGILLIVFGSIMVANIGHISNLPQSIEANSVPIVILILGCIIFIIAFMGCCGAIRENTCLTMTVSICL